MHPKDAEGIANSVDPDLGLHGLPRPAIRKLRLKYDFLSAYVTLKIG